MGDDREVAARRDPVVADRRWAAKPAIQALGDPE
jgi:hypothetical protein